MSAVGSQELKEAHWPSLGVPLQQVTAIQGQDYWSRLDYACRLVLYSTSMLAESRTHMRPRLCFERPRGTAFGSTTGGSSPRQETRPRRVVAEAAAPDPRTNPKVSNSEWTIPRKLFYVQGKQVTSGSHTLGAWRSYFLPHVKAGHGSLVCYVCQGACIDVAALGCEACCWQWWTCSSCPPVWP